jgi:hypothetical protein
MMQAVMNAGTASISQAGPGRGALKFPGYMGKGDALDRAITAFAMAYADQNEKDHAALVRAVKKGTLEAVSEKTRE